MLNKQLKLIKKKEGEIDRESFTPEKGFTVKTFLAYRENKLSLPINERLFPIKFSGSLKPHHRTLK
jgi:hypothetical protein